MQAVADKMLSDEDDDGVFDDDVLDTESIKILLRQSVNPKQRNLFGDVIETETDGAEESHAPQNIKVAFPPTHHQIDFNELKTYLYPTNFEVRDYQFNIVKNSFFNNILVALPTGLGKTFIASTVILNFHRWFPSLKIIFMAPTRPLVAQQIKACCGVTGISSNVVATLLDKTKRNRQEIWEDKSVFFTTPQVVENDLSTGILDARLIVLLVIDEAHRSRGNYAYNNVVKTLSRAGNKSFRILALTATPASDIEGVQEVISNLDISKVEVRTEQSIDIAKYLKRKKVERFRVTNTDGIEQCISWLSDAIAPALKVANERKIYDMRDPLKINAFQVLDAQQRITKNPSIPEGLKWLNYFILQLLAIVGQALRRLVIYGVRAFYSYFVNKYKEFTTKHGKKESKNKMAVQFWLNDNIRALLAQCENQWIKDPKFLGHPKLEIIVSELSDFYSGSENKNSRCIIFTEFRESALDIVRSLEAQQNENLRPHIFIGQAKEKEKFDEVKFLSKNKKAKGKKKESETTDLTSSEDAQMKGMNQKFQKELIGKFKTGEYNILVATSIGEEGLDIGEVDLIICYDSTGSPIKNIQRMGRTGRKRDGKVMLLFASNEEQKFDKAMGGYEYIQQHIMTSKSIELGQSDRIIPLPYVPVIKKVFIEIPEENKEIVKQEDDDEILRIASQYMNKKGKSKAKKSTAPKTLQKVQKPFFMPENVETGFVKAKSLFKKPEAERDILDKIFDSLDEDVEISADKPLVEEIVDVTQNSGVPTYSSPPLSAAISSAKSAPLTSHQQRPWVATDLTRRILSAQVTVERKRSQVIDLDDEIRRAEESSLKRQKHSVDINPPTTMPANDFDDQFDDIFDDQSENNLDDDEEDVFDDGLDIELVKIEERASSVTPISTQVKVESQTIIDDTTKHNDPVYEHEFSNHEGLLTEEEKDRLYTLYYMSVDPSDMATYYDPSEGLQNAPPGCMGHSKKVQRLLEITRGKASS